MSQEKLRDKEGKREGMREREIQQMRKMRVSERSGERELKGKELVRVD